MQVLFVTLRVKPDKIDDFLELVQYNHQNTRQEPGNLRFDVLRSQDDPARFALYEVYRTPDDVSAHQQTAHYARWKSTIDGLLAEPRHRAMFTTLLPPDGGW